MVVNPRWPLQAVHRDVQKLDARRGHGRWRTRRASRVSPAGERTVVAAICRSPENNVRVERDLSPKTSRACATPSIVSMQSTIYECNPTWCRTVAASPGDLCNRRVRQYRQG